MVDNAKASMHNSETITNTEKMKSHYPGCISDEECKCQDHDDDLDCAASSTKTSEQYESQIADLVAMNERLRVSLIKALETLVENSVGRKIEP
jgi:hypothetical protein